MKGQSGQDRKRSESVQDYRTAEQVRVRNIETKTQSHGEGRGESGGRALGSEGGLARGTAVCGNNVVRTPTTRARDRRE